MLTDNRHMQAAELRKCTHALIYTRMRNRRTILPKNSHHILLFMASARNLEMMTRCICDVPSYICRTHKHFLSHRQTESHTLVADQLNLSTHLTHLENLCITHQLLDWVLRIETCSSKYLSKKQVGWFPVLKHASLHFPFSVQTMD